MKRPADASRRRCLLAAGAAGLAAPWTARATTEPPTGWAQPRPAAPATPLNCADGRRRTLRQLLAGQVTAVQLIFTGCNGSCPAQGALFAAVAPRLPPFGLQLLSISIDALGDTPATLADWQARFGRHAFWQAAVPALADVDPLVDHLRGIPGRGGSHTAQVFVFDRQARLAYRTGDAPPTALVAGLLEHVAQHAG